MNQYKQEWMEQALMLVPTTIKLNQNGTIQATWSNPFPTKEKASQFGTATEKTARAVSAGMAIAALDGPIPVLDIIGFGLTTGMSLMAWYEYFSS
jgi:hypothetical protein